MKAGEAKGRRREQLPLDIHAGLVATLFGTVGSFISGILGGLLVPVIGWFRTGQSIFLACTLTILLFALFRILLLLAYRRAPLEARTARAAMWEAAYAVGGIGFMTAVGITAAALVDHQEDEITALYGAVIALGCAGSLAARNAGRPKVVMGQVLGLCVPIALILLVKADAWYWGLAAIFLLVVTSVKSTTHFLNRMLVSALLSERESQRRRRQLSIALNSMSHGLCMTGQDGSITVMNRRLREFFDLSDNVPVATLRELMLKIALHGNLSPTSAGELMRDVERQAGESEARSCTRKIGSRTFVFRCEPMENGGSVMVVEDVTKARKSAEQVERLAHFDTLTGLTNRYQLQKRVRSELSNLEEGRSVALLSIDLDRFKEVNDTLGHQTGDKLLRQVAIRLVRIVGRSEDVARFGGDEFQVLLRPAPIGPELDAFAARLVAGLSKPYLVGGHAISIGASLGIAVAPRDARDGDNLLRCADIALYSAKAASRGTFRHFLPELDAAAERKRRLEQELRQALAENQLEVHYQPMVDLRTGKVTTCEALVRWRHPTRGLVPPDQFIPVAEETGLIAQIGEFVLQRACDDARAWPDDIAVAVNVSAKQFLLRQDLVERIADTLARAGLPAGRLEVEITESTLLDAKDALSALASRGIRLSLDDFGTGYSSLSYLRQFAVHKIKIDRSFIRIQDRASLAIIDAVSFLANTLGIELVAEGVETEAQLQLLRERRIHLVQGFLFSVPRPIGEIGPLLRTAFAPSGASQLRDVA